MSFYDVNKIRHSSIQSIGWRETGRSNSSLLFNSFAKCNDSTGCFFDQKSLTEQLGKHTP